MIIFADTETDIADDSIIVLSLFFSETEELKVLTDLEEMKHILEMYGNKDEHTFVFHFATFDVSIIYKNFGILLYNVECTWIASNIVRNKPSHRTAKGYHSLGALAERYTKYQLDKSLQTTFKKGELISNEQLEYAALDAYVLADIYCELQKEIKVAHLTRTYQLECAIIPVLAQKHTIGLCLNVDKVKEYLKELNYELYYIRIPVLYNVYKEKMGTMQHPEKKIKGKVKLKYEVVNLLSTTQILTALTLHAENIPSNEEGKPTLDKKVLKEFIPFNQHRWEGKLCKAYRQCKEVSQVISMLNSYLELEKDGKIYPQYKQFGANTGRMSCIKPNIQQVPPKIRPAFEARPGYVFVQIDWSGQETVITAYLSNDPFLKDVVKNGKDLHSLFASKIFSMIFKKDIQVDKSNNLITVTNLKGEEVQFTKSELRTKSKAANLAVFYGATGNKLLKQYFDILIEFIPYTEAVTYGNKIYQAYTEVMPKAMQWLREAPEIAKLFNYSLRTNRVTNRRMYFNPDDFTAMQNARVQGTGADAQKLALARMYQQINIEMDIDINEFRPALNVHDEIGIECLPKHLDLIPTASKIMEQALLDLCGGLSKAIPNDSQTHFSK